MFTRCDRRGDRCGCSCHVTMILPSVAWIKHDWFRAIVPVTVTDYTNWNESQRLAKWCPECGRDFEVSQIVKLLPCSLANGPQRKTQKERTRELPIRVKQPMSDVPIFRRKNSDVRFRCLVVRSCFSRPGGRPHLTWAVSPDDRQRWFGCAWEVLIT